MSDTKARNEDGWTRRSIAREPRLAEIVALYEELGFEVRLDPVVPDDPSCRETGCNVCFEDPEVLEPMKLVYTRPRG